LDAKQRTVAVLFYFLIIQFPVCKRTITRFVADDNVVYNVDDLNHRLINVCSRTSLTPLSTSGESD